MARKSERLAALKSVKQAIRSPYAWPGGYPLFAIMSDGGALSIASCKAQFRSIVASALSGSNDGWQVAAVDVNWEDGDLYCDHSGERIESAYAEPEETPELGRFSVTYETITPESAENGDVETRGFIGERMRLRDAFEAVGRQLMEDSGRWFTNFEYGHGTRDYFENMREESRSLHPPQNITQASYERLKRLFEV